VNFDTFSVEHMPRKRDCLQFCNAKPALGFLDKPGTGFHRRANFFDLNFLMRKTLFYMYMLKP